MAMRNDAARAGSPAPPPLAGSFDLERVLEFEFVRATENAALHAAHWLAGGDPCLLDLPLPEVLRLAADALGKRVRDLMVMTLDRPRHADIVQAVRGAGAGLRMISDGDITAAVAPSLPGSGVDLYVGAGG